MPNEMFGRRNRNSRFFFELWHFAIVKGQLHFVSQFDVSQSKSSHTRFKLVVIAAILLETCGERLTLAGQQQKCFTFCRCKKS